MPKKDIEKETVCTDKFDVNGISINRVIKQSLLTKFFPIGNNISGNPRYRDLCSIWIEHKFGKNIAYMTTKYEKQVHQIQNLRIRLFYRIKKLLGKA